MIIDVSNTIGRHKFKAEITAESLLQQMDAAGIDKAVISCYAESLDNESVYRAITAYPDRFIGLYTVNPWDKNAAAELEDALANKGFKGLYMNPIRHGYMLCEHEVFYPLLDVCRKHKAVVWCYGAAETFCLPVFFPVQSDAAPHPGFHLHLCDAAYAGLYASVTVALLQSVCICSHCAAVCHTSPSLTLPVFLTPYQHVDNNRRAENRCHRADVQFRRRQRRARNKIAQHAEHRTAEEGCGNHDQRL